jgi:hypothetical protein
MTTEEILNGRVLIAEFMGYHMKHTKFQTQVFHSSNESHWVWDEGEIVVDASGHEVDDSNNEPYCSLEDLPFNSSWDWLMPVLNKIVEEIEIEDKISEAYFSYHHIDSNLMWLPIKKVFKHVVVIINWYTKNKSNG